ncbi:MAG: Cobalamin adenosyltransferase [Acidobacteriaceae bacterium]|jgi:cob(I)alamin adenosyltransferase|nr:Cobalamin adenosyltransferase [Acidobacteriaceae bacterium]
MQNLCRDSLGAEMVQKDSLRIEAFGTLDECNAAL